MHAKARTQVTEARKPCLASAAEPQASVRYFPSFLCGLGCMLLLMHFAFFFFFLLQRL